jgi:Tfp pilus assembly protein PilF
MNEFLLVAPMALPVMLFGCVLLVVDHRPKRDAVFQMLFLTALCGGAFIFLTHSGIGMSRDWDLFASFVFPAAAASMYIWYAHIHDKHVRERIGVLICAVSLATTTAYVATNASVENGTQRFQTLNDARYWTVGARTYAYDELAAYYREGGDFPAALAQYRNYLSLEPSHPRILANAGFMAEAVGDSLAAAQYFTRSIQNGGDYIDMYTDLGKMYAAHGNIDGAIGVFKLGLQIDSMSLAINSELGQIYYNYKRNFPEALVCFKRVVDLDPQLAEARLSAGLCYAQMGDGANALPYLTEYLRQNPSDGTIAALIKSIKGK